MSDDTQIRLVTKLDSWWKVFSILVTAVAAGVTIGLFFSGYTQMPADVRDVRERVEVLENDKVTEAADDARWRGAVDERFTRLECLVIAGRRGTPIEDCL